MEKHWKEPAEVAARLAAVRDALLALPDWEPAAVEAALRAHGGGASAWASASSSTPCASR